MQTESNMCTQLQKMEVIVQRIVRDTDAAAEIYQDLCLICIQKRGIDWSVSQIGRLVRIVDCLRINGFRRHRINRQVSIDFVAPEKLATTDRDEILTTETSERVATSLSQIDIRYREAIVQKYLCGKTDSMIAEALNASNATVRQWRLRGIRRLREILSDSIN